MNCKEIQEKLSQYIDGYTTQEENEKIAEHLNNCSLCNKEYQDLKKTINLVKDLPAHEAPADFKEELNNRLQKSINEKPNKVRKKSFISWGATAAVVIFMLAAANLTGVFNMGSEEGDLKKTADKSQNKSFSIQSEGKSKSKEKDIPSTNETSASDSEKKVGIMSSSKEPEETTSKMNNEYNLSYKVKNISQTGDFLQNKSKKLEINNFKLQDTPEDTIFVIKTSAAKAQKLLQAFFAKYENLSSKNTLRELAADEKSQVILKIHLQD